MTDSRLRRQGNTTLKRSKPKLRKFFVRIPQEMRNALDQIAVEDERNVSQVARMAFRNFILQRAKERRQPQTVLS